MPPTHTPKGRRHRCATDFVVGGRALGPGEAAWLLDAGAVVRLKTPKQLDDDTVTVVVTGGHCPDPEEFSGVPRTGWSGPASRSSLTDHRPVPVRTQPRLSATGDRRTSRAVHSIAEKVASRGGRALVVGGAVRDALIGGGPVKDVDVEVFGIDAGELQLLLSADHRVDVTGASFSVLKLRRYDIDVSLPRREVKHGTGHRGFLVESDPSMTPEDAARRRDFTINAISYDPLTGEIIDPVGGQADVMSRTLRHVGPQFGEDPLRVLRGAQFIARFALTPDPGTVALCTTLRAEMHTIAQERIFDEAVKLLVKGVRPGAGLRFLDDCDWIEIWPQIAALRGVPQDPRWHPEGDVFVHTAHALDAWAQLRPPDPERDDELITGLAVLTHDLGKLTHTETHEHDDGVRTTSHGHERAGGELARTFVEGISGRRRLAKEVVPLVESHLAPVQLYRDQAGDAAVRRLARRVGRIDRLVRVAHADQAGRPAPGEDVAVGAFPAGEWLLERARALNVEHGPAEPLVTGADVLDAGLRPGPRVGKILAAAAAAQEAGEITNRSEGLALIRRLATA